MMKTKLTRKIFVIKRIVAFVIMISFLFLVNSSKVSAQKIDELEIRRGTYMTAETKQEFAREKMKLYNKNCKMDERFVQTSKESIDQLMATVGFSAGNERKMALEELEKYGIYQYNENNSMKLYADYHGVALNRPNIFYNASSNTWTVTCQGNWVNNSWNPGKDGNLADADGFGVGYTNTSSYNSYVIGASAYITDQYGRNMRSTSYRSDGNGAQGFGFRIQDYKSGYSYVGYKWYGACTYDSNFANFSGNATSYYAHTYATAYIQSITFSAGMSAGVSVTIANQNDGFVAYSGDTKF